MLLEFQSSAFDHSATSPLEGARDYTFGRGRESPPPCYDGSTPAARIAASTSAR